MSPFRVLKDEDSYICNPACSQSRKLHCAGCRQHLARQLDIGLFFTRFDQLAAQLKDRHRMERLRESVWQKRFDFTFDAHADELIAFFRSVIAGSENEANVWRKKLCTLSESTPSTTIRRLVS